MFLGLIMRHPLFSANADFVHTRISSAGEEVGLPPTFELISTVPLAFASPALELTRFALAVVQRSYGPAVTVRVLYLVGEEVTTPN